MHWRCSACSVELSPHSIGREIEEACPPLRSAVEHEIQIPHRHGCQALLDARPGSFGAIPPNEALARTHFARIGIDLGDRWGHYCVLDADGEITEEGRVRMTQTALSAHFSGPRERIAVETGSQSAWVNEHLCSLGTSTLIILRVWMRMAATLMRSIGNITPPRAAGCLRTLTTAATTSPIPQSFNRYSYALNDPLSYRDPLG